MSSEHPPPPASKPPAPPRQPPAEEPVRPSPPLSGTVQDQGTRAPVGQLRAVVRQQLSGQVQDEGPRDGPASLSPLPAQPLLYQAEVTLPAESSPQKPLATWFHANPAQYMVPQRFGMSAILGMITAMALLFGLLRSLNAHPGVYLFFGLLALVICIAQMLNNARPRLASVAAGAILMLPLSLSMLSLLALRPSEFVIAEIVCSALFFIPVGAGLGYLVGTVAAGVFLVMDVLERWWMRRWRGRTGGERAAQDARPGDKPSD